jgi:catechol 2,3-dioxygenase-like lactoylglutathione lyase family enzyme
MSTSGGTPTGFAHVGLTVSDIDVAVAFWAAFLDTQLLSRSDERRDYHATMVGIPGVRIRLAFFALGAHAKLELLEYDAGDRTAAPEATQNPGHAHLCLTVGDLHDAIARATALGAVVVGDGPALIRYGANAGMKAVYMRVPPDSHTLELFEPSA